MVVAYSTQSLNSGGPARQPSPIMSTSKQLSNITLRLLPCVTLAPSRRLERSWTYSFFKPERILSNTLLTSRCQGGMIILRADVTYPLKVLSYCHDFRADE